MNIFPIHALADNYIWMIEDTDSVMIVDPGEAAEVLSSTPVKTEPVKKLKTSPSKKSVKKESV